ncbi:MAG: DNA gyrase subunit A [Nanoarchaeota archaeon]|nr:DNA gyrase subunit A [Nanoarchaeota archaeon]
MVEKIELEGEEIVPREIEEEMQQSYVDYAMSVIVGRALPDVRDGLKPVHRRILYAMNDMGMFHNKPFKKSARIVGEVLGKYHPHGDTAVYDSLARMVQPFSLRYPLIDGQGNFGSIDGDSPAAMRYTEARLKKLSGDVLKDIEKDTVKFLPNFDGSLNEPSVLPSKVPNLLVNGSSGIAVGMATNIPPHNMGEVVDGTIALIDNHDMEIDELMQHIKAPDFPTGAIICGRQGVLHAYKTGRGRVITRGKAETQPEKDRIVITEIPYMVNKAELIKQIADLVNNGKIMGISDIRDESDREGMSVIIELRKDANSSIVLNQLYKHTRLQDTFGIIMVALVDNEPKLLNLKQLIQYFINHRKHVVRKRTEFDLNKADERAHILEGLLIALKDTDRTIKLIKESKSVGDARSSLQQNLSITEKQAVAILEMRLQKLAALEQEKIKNEHSDLLKLIEELKSILSSEQKILEIIKNELLELKKEYGDERRTEISLEETETFEMEDLIKQEKMVITITHSGYIKRQPLNTYRQQKRGGRGIIAAGTKEQDFVEDIFIASTHSYILFFTDKGRIHWLKVYSVPEGSRQSLGKSIVNLLHLGNGEKVSAFIPVKEFKDNEFLIMATKKGTVKKTGLMAYSNPRKGGIIAITLDANDELIGVVKTNGDKQIMLATKNGAAVRFKEGDVRPIGRSAKGVRGATLREGDGIIGMVVADDTRTLLTITENGYGKRSNVSEYRLTNRGGVGVKNIICSERNGNVVAVKSITDNDEIMFISKHGITIRTPAKGVSVIGRATQGMCLMKLGENDKVVAAAKILKAEPSENGNGDKEEKTEEIENKVEPEQQIEDKKKTPKEIEDKEEKVEEIETKTEPEKLIEDKEEVQPEIEDKTEPEKEMEDKGDEELVDDSEK